MLDIDPGTVQYFVLHRCATVSFDSVLVMEYSGGECLPFQGREEFTRPRASETQSCAKRRAKATRSVAFVTLCLFAMPAFLFLLLYLILGMAIYVGICLPPAEDSL